MRDPEIDDGFWQSHAVEWDENKRRENLAKHGIDFLDAPEVFGDQRQRTFRSKHPPEERRYITLGQLESRLVAVIWTRRGDRLRIISIRRARRNERRFYEEAS